MSAIDLALAAGGAMTVFWGLFLLRRRRTRARLHRLSRHRRTTLAERWPRTDRLPVVLVDRPRTAITATSAVAAGIGLLTGGLVAAVLGGAYAAIALIGVRRQLVRRAADRAVAELLDTIEDTVGDLRAGVVPYATATPYPGGADVELYAALSPTRLPGAGGLGATVRRIWEASDRQPGRQSDRQSDRQGTAPATGDRIARRRRLPAGLSTAEGGRLAQPRQVAATGRARVDGRATDDGRAVERGWPVVDGAGVAGSGQVAGGGGGSSAAAGGGRARRREDAAVAVASARLEAAHRVSEALGTPLADLLDRVEADLRAGQTLRLNLVAQTSGAQTTTTLLLGLPMAGLWLGASIGVDPVNQLLHTPLGASCAIVAVALQCAGMLWTGQLVSSVIAEVW